MDKTALVKQHFSKYFDDNLIEKLVNDSIISSFVEGKKILRKGEPFEYVIFNLKGTLKVLRSHDDESEHLLFYTVEGESCVATYGICDHEEISEVDIEAETDTIVLLFPKKEMDNYMARFPQWRKYILQQLQKKIGEFLDTLDSITFMHLDERVIKYLKEKSRIKKSDEIHVTHQEIADELSTSRVVISRLLKMLERQGKIKLGRNKIKILDIEG